MVHGILTKIASNLGLSDPDVLQNIDILIHIITYLHIFVYFICLFVFVPMMFCMMLKCVFFLLLFSYSSPLTVHCSPGTGRTGTIIACDIAIRSLETPKRTVDIPHIVYYVRRGRASAVLTKEQYEFIYKVANMYAAKITNPSNYN